ncbi:MAG: hypothetical protein HZB38_15095 [Planctomycetes bacterium]|nr:hypothetical protein [Planctomycetota bacterium]
MQSMNQITVSVAEIERLIGQVETNNGAVEPLAEANHRLNELRQAYRERPATVHAFVDTLRKLRARLDRLLAQRGPEAADRYFDISAQIRRLEQDREFWRAALIASAGDSPRPIYGTLAEVHVRTTAGRSVPPAGSEARRHLENLVRAAGLWEKSSQLTGPKLHHALESANVSAEVAASINSACPVTPRRQIVCRSRGEPPL